MGAAAHCVALSVNAVQAPGHRSIEGGEHADVLARELALDMSTYWQPTVENYLAAFPRSASVRPCTKASPMTPPRTSPP
jgi:hypothetical protein